MNKEHCEYYTSQERVAGLLKNWTKDNLSKLYEKMKNKGVNQGGILSTAKENRTLFKYLEKTLNGKS